MDGKASSMSEEEREFLWLLGFLHLRYGRWEDARVIFRGLKALFPGEPAFAKALGFALLKTGEYRAALREIDRFLEKASEKEDLEAGYWLKSKALWGLGHGKKARDQLDRLLAVKGGERWGGFGMAPPDAGHPPKKA